MTKEEFLIKANEKHNNKYDYSLVPDNLTYSSKIEVICNEKFPWGEPHGKFVVQVGKHLSRGDGCSKCSGNYKRSKEEFVRAATYIHKGLYTYDDFVMVNGKTKGKIHCTKHNIDFEMTPDHHLQGQGCPKCRYEKASKAKTKSTEKFIEQAKQIHGDKYDYSKVEYVNGHEKVCIICPEHGEFWMTPNNHINKTKPQGCPVCGRIKSIRNRTSTTEEFITKAIKIYGNKYDYSKVNYVNNTTNVEIVCPQHGSFFQWPANHLIGESCPKCACFRSKGEKEVEEFVRGLGFEISTSDRQILNGDELDIVIPQKKIAIEYNGLRWHSNFFKPNDYHLQKTMKCEERGYRLIHIFEDEWIYKKDITKSRIKNILGVNGNVIYARNCHIKEVDGHTSNKFLFENHIQGKCASSIKLGLFYNDELVSLMTFGKSRHFIGNGKTEWELLRFCNKMDTRVVGGASKLLKHFIKTYNPNEIVSYADKRWSDGNLYEVLGFQKYNESKPNYFYIINGKREYRFNYRKSILVKQGFDPNKTEKEIMEERGIPRIYDCGCLCYKWINNQNNG